MDGCRARSRASAASAAPLARNPTASAAEEPRVRATTRPRARQRTLPAASRHTATHRARRSSRASRRSRRPSAGTTPTAATPQRGCKFRHRRGAALSATYGGDMDFSAERGYRELAIFSRARPCRSEKQDPPYERRESRATVAVARSAVTAPRTRAPRAESYTCAQRRRRL